MIEEVRKEAQEAAIPFRISSGFSLIGSSCVCFLFFKLRWWNNSTHHIILFAISVADIIYSTALFVGPSVSASSKWCPIQGWMVHMSGCASQIWCALLGLNLWLQMRYYWKDIQCRKMMPWYHVFGWGVPSILAAIPACSGILEHYGLGCGMPKEETWFIAFTHFIPMWVCFLFNWFIILRIVLLLRRIIATIPEDMDNGSSIKRHFKFVTCQTIMFIIAGMSCWGIYLFTFDWWNLPVVWVGLVVFVNPLQGFVNLLVYVSPSYLHKFCNNKGNDKEPISIREEPFSKMEQDVQAVEIVMTKAKANDIEFDEDEESSTIGSLAGNDFRLTSERMSFFEGQAQHAIDIVRRRLSESTPHLEAKAAGGRRSDES